jgi:hypothetical protein
MRVEGSGQGTGKEAGMGGGGGPGEGMVGWGGVVRRWRVLGDGLWFWSLGSAFGD